MSYLQGLSPPWILGFLRRTEAFPYQLNIISKVTGEIVEKDAVGAIRELLLSLWQERHALSRQHYQIGFSSLHQGEIAPKHLPDCDGFAFYSVGVD